jgi:hypothetical protein
MAKDAEHRTWYRVALARPQGDQLLVAASGVHIGEAVAAAQRAHPDTWPIALDVATEGQIPLGDSVGKGHVVDLGSATEPCAFRWPVGVLPKLGRTEAVAAATAGYAVTTHGELFVIEVQVPADKVIDTFMSLIERLPSADNLEIRVLDHYEDTKPQTDVWITSRINAKKIIRFLDDHDEEFMGNGHLELSIYVRASKATLRLTEHKTIAWLADDRALEDDVTRWLGEIGVPRLDHLVSIRDTAHFHYRPDKSRTRDRMSVELYKERLRRADTIKKAAVH